MTCFPRKISIVTICGDSGNLCLLFIFLTFSTLAILVLIEAQLIYNVVLVSGVQQSDLVTFISIHIYRGFPRGSDGENPSAMQGTWVHSLGQEDSLERKQQPTPVFLPGEFHGQRSLVGYRPWDHKKSATTERLTLLLSQFILRLTFCVLHFKLIEWT